MNESIDEKEDSYTQMYTQTAKNAGKPKSAFISQNSSGVLRAGSSAWYECLTCTQEAAGSNPARSTSYGRVDQYFRKAPAVFTGKATINLAQKLH